MKKLFCLTASILISLSSFSQGGRIALVIGNAEYNIGPPLANPVNDAKDIAQILSSTGFEVTSQYDIGLSEMKRSIDQFGEKLKGAEAALFFYAGHGIQAKGRNYLIPVDAVLNNENDVEYNCVDAGRILAKMGNAATKTNIVILDACRNNPFERSWSRTSTGAGLASMDAPGGSIIEYSTSPGMTASDGYFRNSPYTAELKRYMNTPGLKIEDVFKLVRIKVFEKTNGHQVPWEHSSLMGDFYFTSSSDDAGSNAISKVPENEIKDILGMQDTYPALRVNGYEQSRKEISSGIRSVAILPFSDYTNNESNIYLASGIQDALISELGRLGQVRVISKTSTLSYASLDKTLSEIAGELNVEGLIEASLIGLGDNVRIQLKLFSIYPEERLIWSQVFDSDLSDILGLYNRVIKEIAEEINLTLSSEDVLMLQDFRKVDPEAYKAYVLGRHYWNSFTPEDLKSAMNFFEKAKELDTDFALAYLGISDTWYALYQIGVYPPTDPVPMRNMYLALNKAIELDNTLVEAHYSAGNLKAGVDWDWEGAKQEYDRALSINPNHADTYGAYSNLLASLGETEKSIEMIDKAIAIDPNNLFTKALNAATLLFARQYQKSIAACLEVLAIDPNNFLVQQIISFSYHLNGQYKDELDSWKSFLVSQYGIEQELIESVFVEDYSYEAYRKTINTLADTLYSTISSRYFDIFIIGMYYTCGGNTEKALELLEKSIEQHNPNSVFLLNPVFDAIRSEPRFVQMCKKLNLPHN